MQAVQWEAPYIVVHDPNCGTAVRYWCHRRSWRNKDFYEGREAEVEEEKDSIWDEIEFGSDETGPEEMLWSMQLEENWMLPQEVEQEASWNIMTNDILGEKILEAATTYDKTVRRGEMMIKAKRKIVTSMDNSYAREYPTVEVQD